MPPDVVAPYLREAVASVDREVPVQIETMGARVAQLAARPRFLAFLLVAFGVLALVIAAAGLAAVAGYLVTERTRDIGVRMAVGATSARVATEVLQEAALWCAGGVAFGTLLIAVLQQALESLLYETLPSDAVSWLAALAILAAVAVTAALRPALRAARIDPMTALRSE